ncbi:MAG: hypothetical protein ACOX2S_04825 [bacterium]
MQGAVQWSLACVDAGSEFCPCYLGMTGECLVCSLLRGEDFCSCSWSGSCSYLNQRWSRGRIKERRKEEVEVEKEELTPGLISFRLRLEQELVRELNNPGSFLFLRPVGVPEAAALPVSVVDTEGREVWLVVVLAGPKTRLLSETDGKLVVHGPYYNGVLGLATLKSARAGTAVIVAGGVGQSTAVLVARQLIRGGNRVKACLAPGSAGRIYVAEKLRGLGVEVTEVKSMRTEGLPFLAQWLKEKPLVVFSGGPDSLHRAVMELVRKEDGDTELVCSQNSVICCGDGLCGSCVDFLADGRRVPKCKAQYRIAKGGSHGWLK